MAGVSQIYQLSQDFLSATERVSLKHGQIKITQYYINIVFHTQA